MRDLLTAEPADHRRRLFECIADNPGAHVRDLTRRVGLALGTTTYHLERLEASGLVVVRRDGRYKRYFAGYELGPAEKELMCGLRRESPRRILTALLDVGEATQRELCALVGVSRSTLSFHVSRLAARGVLLVRLRGPENVYSIADRPLASRMIVRYAASIDRSTSPASPVALAPGAVTLTPTFAIDIAPATATVGGG